MTSEPKEGIRNLLKRLSEFADEAAMAWADESDLDFIEALINMEEQLEPQLKVYDATTIKRLCMVMIVDAAEVRKELQLGTKIVSKVGERTVVTKHAANGRIAEFEKRDVYGVVDA
jgi:hypothetical protein